jgi:hypothetical protein
MCHGYMPRDRSEESYDRTEENSDEEPSFLDVDSDVDTEILTDGGDEEEDTA